MGVGSLKKRADRQSSRAAATEKISSSSVAGAKNDRGTISVAQYSRIMSRKQTPSALQRRLVVGLMKKAGSSLAERKFWPRLDWRGSFKDMLIFL